MIITVKTPGDCPLRYQDDDFVCAVVQSTFGGMDCKDSEKFPVECPLRTRTVIVQKEETETVPKHKEQPVTADIEK